MRRNAFRALSVLFGVHPCSVNSWSKSFSRQAVSIPNSWRFRRSCNESSIDQNICHRLCPDVMCRKDAFQVAANIFKLAISNASTPYVVIAADDISRKENHTLGITDKEIASLVYRERLGKGSFKSVYMVESCQNNIKYALSVQRLRGKDDVNDAIQGIHISEFLQAESRKKDVDPKLFEKIIEWWVQPSGLVDFKHGEKVFPNFSPSQRTRKVPKNFLGSKWLIAIKPLYDLDLKSFCQQSPNLYPIGIHLNIQTIKVSGALLDSTTALRIALMLCHAGSLMHDVGVVHRDIKPKNIMLKDGNPVIIDFGFSKIVKRPDSDGRLCITEPGTVRGEVGFVLPSDVKRSKACQEGDLYAMGKTLYQFIFGEVMNDNSKKVAITEEESNRQRAVFQTLLGNPNVGRCSRFSLSDADRAVLVTVIRGLCREDDPYSFRQAESIILDFLTK